VKVVAGFAFLEDPTFTAIDPSAQVTEPRCLDIKSVFLYSKPTHRLEDAVELYRRVRTLGYADSIIITLRS
jgi:hypothetical protein